MSGRAFARAIPRWRSLGYRVELYFLSLNSPENAIARVALRVRQGGHNIPEDVIRRRFYGGLQNFHEVYKPLVDHWSLIDNTDGEQILLDEGENERRMSGNRYRKRFLPHLQEQWPPCAAPQ